MRSIIAGVLLICFIPAVQAADEENPLKKAKVGDWIEYKMTSPLMEGKTKMVVLEKSDKSVTIETTSKLSAMGNEVKTPPQKQKIDLTKPYDPATANKPMMKGAKVEKGEEGEEKIKIGDKEYDTKWTKSKTSITVGGMTLVSESKVWICKDVPFGGMIKMETSTMGIEITMELIGTGSK